MGFNGYHVSQIVTNAGWEDKLKWIRDNYESVLKPMGFKPTHTAQIVRGADWERKIEYIIDNYKYSLYSHTQLSRIMKQKQWAEKLGYKYQS